MLQTIHQKLLEMEQTENIKILYACESGSRAWGFASPDSDFDVRFIYVKPLDHYLQIIDQTDVAGLPVNEVLDIGGWDLRKALKLFLTSNSTMYEWLQSPIVYTEQAGFADELRKLMPKYFSLRAGAHHYLSMANNALTQDLQGDEVKLKRYFYALRPALACLWIIEKRSVPPMEFEKLRILIADEKIQQAINDLMEQKKLSGEKTTIAPVLQLNHWLTDTLNYCRLKTGDLENHRHLPNELNAVFRKYIPS
jgi:predicted nucleotidyltransferase